MKKVENPEQLLERFAKRTAQLTARKVQIQPLYVEYLKLEKDLTRLEGSIQAIEYAAYGKMPGDGNHDKFENHRP